MVLRQLKAHTFSSSSYRITRTGLKRCLPSVGRQAGAGQVGAGSDLEEAQLRADYGALSQRVEVNIAAKTVLLLDTVA